MYNFDTEINRFNTGSMKWSRDGVLPLTVADMDFEMPAVIKESIKKRVDDGILGYTLGQSEDYLNCVIEWQNKRHKLNINKNDIMLSHGVIDGFNKCIDMLCKADERVIFQTPAYPPYFHINREYVLNPMLNNGNGYEVDFNHLEFLCSDPKNKVLLLCNPQNPTGRVFTEYELLTIANICAAHDIVIISDEIHGDWTRTNINYVPMQRLLPEGDIITCISVSKTFNLAGLEISNIIINEGMRERMKITEPFHQCGNPLSMAATMGAYSEDGTLWLDECRQYVDTNMKWVKEKIDAELPLARVYIPEGTYMMWVDVRNYTRNTEKLSNICREKYHVAFNEGEMFKAEGFMRLTLASPMKLIERGITEIIKAIKEL